MAYIHRELLDKLTRKFNTNRPAGCILSGIVGCGKTTLVEKLLSSLANQYEVFIMTGDDIIFRRQVAEDSNHIINFVQSITNRRAIVFVDEVQKSEKVFDALKIAFDKGKISFIVSGSNPSYLSTVAKKRLQRRAEQIYMLPLALSEIFIAKGIIDADDSKLFTSLLWTIDSLDDVSLPKQSLTDVHSLLIKNFLLYGGLPLSHLATSDEDKLREIRLTTERGFDLMSSDNGTTGELVKAELANLNSKEFTYKYILTKTRLKKRDEINKIIDDLINHGYLVRKKPTLLPKGKSSYLSVFSYIDPGVVTYISGDRDLESVIGTQVEGYLHARLSYMSLNSSFKSEIAYYKPHIIDNNGQLKYQPGEIDFIFTQGKRMIPIEVKSTPSIGAIKTPLLEKIVKEKKCPYGIVLYGGVPKIIRESKIIYWPYWMV